MSEGEAIARGLSKRALVEAMDAMPCGGLGELRSRSQKSRSTSPMSEEAREVGGLMPTLTPTLTSAGGERAPGLVSGDELDTSEQLSSPMAERLSVATPEPNTNIPSTRAVASTLAKRWHGGRHASSTDCHTRESVASPTDHLLVSAEFTRLKWQYSAGLILGHDSGSVI